MTDGWEVAFLAGLLGMIVISLLVAYSFYQFFLA
jgi:hypothetical protein